MKYKAINLLLGILLLLAGGLVLAQNLGWIAGISSTTWLLVLSALSVMFFGLFALSGWKDWGWLFPSFILAGIAATIALSIAGVDGSLSAAPVLLGCGLPFLSAYLLDRKGNWWALIPFWVLLAVTVMLAFVDFVPGEVVAFFIFISIAIPFLVLFLLDRSRRWALIPAYVLAAISFIPLLANTAGGEFVGAYVMFMISLPFFLIYFTSTDSWWALLPAGSTASVGLLILLVGLDWPGMQDTIAVGAMFLGLAATFWGLYLRRSRIGTEWARFPAIALAIFGLLMAGLGGGMGSLWPVLLILGGVLMLLMGLRRRKTN